MKNARTIRQLIAATAAVFLGFLPKVVGCILLAGTCAWPAAAELVVIDSGFTNLTATTLSYVTNRYDGHGHVIRDDLTLSNVSYLRLKGGTLNAPDRLDVGPADSSAANQCPVITIGPDCGFYCCYRSSEGKPDPDTSSTRSFLETYIGANGGSAKFVVQSSAMQFGGNLQSRALWLEDVFVSENATSDGDYLDIVQLDVGGGADIDMLYNYNDKPARILFNGGSIYDNFSQHNGEDSNGPFRPAFGKTIVLEGINGKDIRITKVFYGHDLNGGSGTLRFQGDCNIVLDDGGTVLPGLKNANRSALTLNSAKGPIEWGQKGDLILAGQAHIKCAGDNRLPYTAEEGIVRMREKLSNKVLYGAILDLDNTSQRVRSLIAEGTAPMVTNVANSAYTNSKLVFGYGNTDGIFSAKTYYGVSAEKVGTGTLVISNATVDVNNTGSGTLSITEGAVIFIGTNKIGDKDILASDRCTIASGITVAKNLTSWGEGNELVLGDGGFLKLGADDKLPGGVTNQVIQLNGDACLDLDDHSCKVRSLIGTSSAVVSNATHETYTNSKLVFGAENTDGVFSAKTCYGVSAEKVGTGTLVISNATVDVNATGNGEFVAKEGTVILVGTNKIGDKDMLASGKCTIEPGVTVAKNLTSWGEGNDLVLGDGGFLLLGADDKLPGGVTNQVVRLNGDACLDLDGHSCKVRSLIGTSSAVVSNATHEACTNSKLVCGADNTDGIFAGHCTCGVNVEKIGTGTLVFSNATVEGTVTVKAGKVRFVGSNNIPNLVVEEGADVVSVGTLETTSDSIKRINVNGMAGKYVVYDHEASGETLLRAGDELGGMKLNVGSGKIRFAGDCSDKWWRLVMLQAASVTETDYSQANHVELTEFSLYASNVMARVSKGENMLNYGLKTNETGTAWTSYSDMPSGTCTEGFGETYIWNPTGGRKWWGPSALCDSNGTHCFQTTGEPPIRDDTPRNIIYRLKDTSPAVSSYTVCYTQWSNQNALKKWRLESSSDGDNWTVRDEHEAQWANTSECKTEAEKRAKSEIPYFAFGTAGYYNNGVPYRFTKGASAAESFTNVRVSVTSGATLDTTYINDEVLSFAELNVDTVGGTITKFAPMANGRVNLVNFTMTMEPQTVMTVSNVLNAVNLSTWKVYINGVENPAARITLDGTELKVGLVQTDAVWTAGGGDDTSTETAANWQGSVAPNFSVFPCAYRPVFGEGGSEAVFPSGISYLNGLKFSREGDFTVRGAADTRLVLNGTVEVAAGESELDQRRYDIAAPLEVAFDSQNWNVPTNKTLRTSGGITNAEGVASVALTKQGLGKLELVDSRVAGDIIATDPDCGVLSLSGDIGVPGDSGQLSLQNFTHAQNPTTGKYGATYRGYLHLGNATIYKPFEFKSPGNPTCTNGNNSQTWLTMTPGSTNVFKELVTQIGSSASSYWLLDSNSTIVFEKGYGDESKDAGKEFNVGMKAGCTNGTFIFNGPIRMVKSGGKMCFTVDNSGAKVVFASTGNVCADYLRFNNYTAIFKVDDAFVNTPQFEGTKGGTNTVIDLGVTRQSAPIWNVRGHGVVKGDYPATLAITNGSADEALNMTYFYPNAINGWVKISKSGEGYQKVGRNDSYAWNCASYGDFEVSGGTLELTSTATWRNGTNFISRGSGTLKFNAAGQVNANFARLHMADSGQVEIPEGVTVSVYAARTNGIWLAAGQYTCESEGAAGATGIPQLTGKGVLSVSAMGYVIEDDNEPSVRSVVIDKSWVDDKVPEGKTVYDPASNGFKYWKCYVLGLDPADKYSKPIIKGVQNADPEKLAFALGNVNYNADSGVKATYRVEESTSLSGGFESRGSTNAGEVIEFALPNGGTVHYYKAVISYSN